MRDRIQTWASLLLGAAVVALVGWLTAEQLGRTHVRAPYLFADGGAAASAGTSADAGAATVAAGASTTSTTDAGPAAGGPIAALDTTGDGGFTLGGLGSLLDSGAMPTTAPRSVKLGVVLVQFAGAEGAPSSARAKPDALKHAQEVVEQARADWKAAVKAGDSGSSEDIGRIPRGVLAASTEVAVFSLAAGEISEPLETPRGYWIVKRVE